MFAAAGVTSPVGAVIAVLRTAVGSMFGRRRVTSVERREVIPPPGLTQDAQLTDSLWNLYSPQDKAPEVDIVFFHGLQVDDYENAFWKTWLAKDKKDVVWPKDWLSKKLPGARILSVSYNSSATKVAGQSDMYILGENLVGDIINAEIETGIGQTCPVFLVGHCLGGIVIKKLILSAIKRKSLVKSSTIEYKRIQNFLDNFKGAFFYATPNGGSEEITKFASSLTHPSEILHLLKTLDKETGRINYEFSMQRDNWNARTYGVTELLPTTSMGFHGQVVLEASARFDVDNFYTHTSADHFTVCQARTIDDSTVIRKLTDFICSNMPCNQSKAQYQQADLAKSKYPQ